MLGQRSFKDPRISGNLQKQSYRKKTENSNSTFVGTAVNVDPETECLTPSFIKLDKPYFKTTELKQTQLYKNQNFLSSSPSTSTSSLQSSSDESESFLSISTSNLPASLTQQSEEALNVNSNRNPNSSTIPIRNSILFDQANKKYFLETFQTAFKKKINAYKKEALHGTEPGIWQKSALDLVCGAITAALICTQVYEDKEQAIDSVLLYSVANTLITSFINPLITRVYSNWDQRQANKITEASYFLRKDLDFQSSFLNKFVDEFYSRFDNTLQNFSLRGGVDVAIERLAEKVTDEFFKAILKCNQVRRFDLELPSIDDREVNELIETLLEKISV